MTVNEMKVVGIQVQTTLQDFVGYQVVSSTDPKATHWSVYLRMEDGTADWYTDRAIENQKNSAFKRAMGVAGVLSIKYRVPIEAIQ